ncbi:hypothetical protein U1Q18_017189 [Sarracenia purpurea var. burkii]
MKPSIIICILILTVFSAQLRLNAANDRLPLIVNPKDLKGEAATVVVNPCKSHCIAFCCYCNIRKVPPVCEKCCEEE